METETKKIKITEIKEHYKVKRKEKNANGEMVEVEKTMWRFKEVPYVTGWPRFGHFLLDRVFYSICVFLMAAGVGVILGLSGNAGAIDSTNETIINVMEFLIIYPFYYLIMEAATQASLAKLVLGRVVVNEYGEKPTFSQILGRSYARIVPFEPFSCFGNTGWHDDWSKTFVLRKRDLEDLMVLARLQQHIAEEPASPEAQ
ncbi:MAG: RDD family protein [Bacteroidia bacterium]